MVLYINWLHKSNVTDTCEMEINSETSSANDTLARIAFVNNMGSNIYELQDLDIVSDCL